MNSHALTLLEFEKVRRMLVRWTFSPPGRRTAEALAPHSDLREIERSQRRIAEWRALELRGEAPEPAALPELEPMLVRVERGADLLDGAELVSIVPLLELAARLHRLRATPDPDASLGPELSELLSRIEDPRSLLARWRRSLAPSGELLDSASPDLARVRRASIEAQQRASDLLNRLLDRLSGGADESFVTLRDGRYVLSVRTNQRAALPGIVHGRSQTGQSVHVEPLEALEANNAVAEASDDVRRVETEVRRELTGLLRAAAPGLRASWEAVGTIDVVRAGARLALELGAEAPEVRSGAPLRIVLGRHPLLAAIERGGGARVVPLELEIDRARPVLVVSGPNMGGKTVVLQTIGLLTAMAGAGLFVPAGPGTILPLVDDLFVDLGDEQSVEADVSTFAGHLENFGDVWERATESSLVLLDELGGGTDPEEGAALALALLQGLAERGTLTLATTHLSAIKRVAEAEPRMQNAAMEFDAASMRPSFRLRAGEAGRSRAFEIARRLLPDSDLVSRAQRFRSEDSVRLDTLQSRLEEARTAAEAAHAELERETERLTAARGRYEREAERLRGRIDALRSARAEQTGRLYEQAKQAVESLRSETEARLRAIVEAAESDARSAEARAAGVIREAERELDRRAQGSARRERRPDRARLLSPDLLRPGVRAWSPDLRSVVRISQASEGAGRVWVEWAGRRVEVSAGSLEQLPEGVGTAGPSSRSRPALPVTEGDEGPIERELDLRGLRADEAIVRLERFLDRSVLRGVSPLRIVHGKGTGALKRAIEGFLAQHPQVGRARQGDRHEGGWGVTVIELEGPDR